MIVDWCKHCHFHEILCLLFFNIVLRYNEHLIVWIRSYFNCILYIGPTDTKIIFQNASEWRWWIWEAFRRKELENIHCCCCCCCSWQIIDSIKNNYWEKYYLCHPLQCFVHQQHEQQRHINQSQPHIMYSQNPLNLFMVRKNKFWRMCDSFKILIKIDWSIWKMW